jgi:hypothetical protein
VSTVRPSFSVAKFLHISFQWSGAPKMAELEPVFDQALEWMRYAPNCWIVWTTTDATGWHNRLISHITANDRLFVCELNMANKQGWMERWAWDWMNKPRSAVLQRAEK